MTNKKESPERQGRERTGLIAQQLIIQDNAINKKVKETIRWAR